MNAEGGMMNDKTEAFNSSFIIPPSSFSIMEPFRRHTGTVAPLDRPNVDTDQIIPKQFLKRIERTGFGQFLFWDWRYDASGRPDASFVLNEPRYSGATILVAGRNFGCGSSREHAPWALLDYGFRAIIAPSFADIFMNNCMKNGIVPVVLSEAATAELLRRAQESGEPAYAVTVDLERRVVEDARGFSSSFEIDDFRRHCLLEGLDDIGLTLRNEPQIAAYEARRAAWRTAR
jgi:3-isopropylmalate/(R)-2-methylmalate dehydratase small subunit